MIDLSSISKKTWILLGLPPIVTLALLIVLFLRLYVSGPEVQEPGPAKQEVSQDIQSKTDSTTDLNFNPDDDTLDQEALPLVSPDVIAEMSYLLEKNSDNWNLLTRKDALSGLNQWRIFIAQNSHKILFTIFPEHQTDRLREIQDSKRLVIRQAEENLSSFSFDRSRKKQHALQLLSFQSNDFIKAVEVTRKLTRDGYPAYISRTSKPIKTKSMKKPSFFYRVRIGFFETEREAREKGDEILEKYQDNQFFVPDFWAVKPDYIELSDEVVNFGSQRNKPYIIEFSNITSKIKAYRLFEMLSPFTEFAFIAQKKISNNNYQYRVQIGFYEGTTASNKAANNLVKVTKSELPTYHILKKVHSLVNF